MTRVERGITLGGETRQRGMIHACQARVFSDLTLAVEALPPVDRIEARVTGLIDVTHDVVEVTLAPSTPLTVLPGQYCRFGFRGFPERAFSPTALLDGRSPDVAIRLNVKRVHNGRVSTNLGGRINIGHRLTINGPFGHAFLRPGLDNRLVLVASGTGFAPMWAIAHAALCENARRPIVIVAGVRELASFYMSAALEFAAAFPNVHVIATAEERQSRYRQVRHGRPSDHVPTLVPDDIVYAAGAPAMVEVVGQRALEGAATFYSDPFEPAGADTEDWVSRAAKWLRVG